jgi:hypothetical protein
MRRWPAPLTAAAPEIVLSCLEIAADRAVAFDPLEAWRAVYPRSAACFTPALARATLCDLFGKLRLPEAYGPTAYHWLLLYESLKVQIEALNAMPLPALVAQLTTWATAHDARALSLPTRAQGVEGFHSDVDALIDTYFWDTDCLMDAESFARLSAEAKTNLGLSPSIFGVTQGLAPHPEELVLQRAEESPTPKSLCGAGRGLHWSVVPQITVRQRRPGSSAPPRCGCGLRSDGRTASPWPGSCGRTLYYTAHPGIYYQMLASNPRCKPLYVETI